MVRAFSANRWNIALLRYYFVVLHHPCIFICTELSVWARICNIVSKKLTWYSEISNGSFCMTKYFIWFQQKKKFFFNMLPSNIKQIQCKKYRIWWTLNFKQHSSLAESTFSHVRCLKSKIQFNSVCQTKLQQSNLTRRNLLDLQAQSSESSTMAHVW